MEGSCFPPELLEQFECADADYNYCYKTQADLLADEDRGSLSEGESSAGEDEMEVNDSVREEDEAEDRMVDEFITNGCGCALGAGKSPCSKSFNREELSTTRYNCSEMSSTELDMLVLANLDAHRHSSEKRSTGTSTVSDGRRVAIDYSFRGKRVCKGMFLFAHGIGPKRFKNLVTHFEKHGLVSRRHGNTKRLLASTISFSRTQAVVAFIHHFATIHALPLPGRLPGQYSDEKALLLPSHMSKRHVYRQYCHACAETGETPVRRRKFENLWNELIPHIACMKPASDLCEKCHSNVVSIMRSANLPESDKTERLKEAENHLRLAKQEREVYNDECRQAAKELKLAPQLPKVVHYSFDFAQQIHFPSSPQQVGPLYFLTPRKCQLFGVCSEAKAEQVNYLIDECWKRC